MKRAEAKRWNTWVNAMCIMTFIRRFYPKCYMCMITTGRVLELRINVLCKEYDINEIAADIDTFKEETAKVWLYNRITDKELTICIKWEVEEDDSELY